MDLLRNYFPLRLLLHSLNPSYTSQEVSSFLAPWPEPQHRGGTTSFPLLVPVARSHPEAGAMAALRTFLSTWTKPTLVLYSSSSLLPWLQGGDFVVGNRAEFYRWLIPGVQRVARVADSGHLVMWDQPLVVVREVLAFVGL